MTLFKNKKGECLGANRKVLKSGIGQLGQKGGQASVEGRKSRECVVQEASDEEPFVEGMTVGHRFPGRGIALGEDGKCPLDFRSSETLGGKREPWRRSRGC